MIANINGFQVCPGRCHANRCYYFSSSQNKMLHFPLVMSFQNQAENGKGRNLLMFLVHIPQFYIFLKRKMPVEW